MARLIVSDDVHVPRHHSVDVRDLKLSIVKCEPAIPTNVELGQRWKGGGGNELELQQQPTSKVPVHVLL